MINIITLIVVALGIVLIAVLLGMILVRMRAVAETRAETARASGAIDAVRSTITESMSRLDRSMGEMGRMSQALQDETRRLNEFFEALKGSGQKGGRFGEFLLEDIVKDLIPDVYRDFQCQLGPNRVDCAVRIGDRRVPIDAKFSVSALEREKDFRKPVKARIDEVTKYISPEHDTTDFALMFIPSDGLYSRILDDAEIVQYALDRRVIPVSPTTLYAYLATVALGIRRDEIAVKVDQVIGNIRALENDLHEAFTFLNRAEGQVRGATANIEKTRSALFALQLKLQSVDVGWETEEQGET